MSKVKWRMVIIAFPDGFEERPIESGLILSVLARNSFVPRLFRRSLARSLDPENPVKKWCHLVLIFSEGTDSGILHPVTLRFLAGNWSLIRPESVILGEIQENS